MPTGARETTSCTLPVTGRVRAQVDAARATAPLPAGRPELKVHLRHARAAVVSITRCLALNQVHGVSEKLR